MSPWPIVPVDVRNQPIETISRQTGIGPSRKTRHLDLSPFSVFTVGQGFTWALNSLHIVCATGTVYADRVVSVFIIATNGDVTFEANSIPFNRFTNLNMVLFPGMDNYDAHYGTRTDSLRGIMPSFASGYIIEVDGVNLQAGDIGRITIEYDEYTNY
jgi:hypothetical protein